MNRHIAFLRGINLGNRRLEMSRLRSHFVELGLGDVETFIASGNVLFSTRARDLRKCEDRIAAHLEKSLGYPVDTFIRTTQEVMDIGRLEVFPDQGDAGTSLYVAFLRQKPGAETARGLENIRSDVDAFRVRGREVYWLCRVRSSESKIWASPEMKALRLPTMTLRNLTSIRKLIARHL